MVSVRYLGGLWNTLNEELQGQISACLQRTYSDLEIEGQSHKTIVFVALPIYTYIPNLKGLTK